MKFFVLDISRIGFAAANFSIFSEKLESILRNFLADKKQNYSPRCSNQPCRHLAAGRVKRLEILDVLNTGSTAHE